MSGCLIDCVPGQEEFKKKKACPESSIWSIDVGECGREGERWKGGKMKGGRKRETRREGLFFGFSASVIKLSHVRDRWSWCLVCVYVHASTCKCRLMWSTQMHTHAQTHTLLSPALDSAPSGASQGSYQTSAICSKSALRVGQLISSQIT